jgi:Tat protein secretion system quality control protein TatD with DNase activity
LTPDKDPEGTGSPTSPRSLAARADQYRNEVEKVVRTVGEHPQYELKRSVELSALSKKIEFVKDIQAIGEFSAALRN